MSETLDASVVVCVRNRPAALMACLESIALTVGVGFETIVVDDGSNDDTPRVAKQMGELRPALHLRLVRNPVNLGVSGARNVGIRAAAAPIVAFTDSDCVVEPEWLAGLVRAFDSFEVAAVAGEVIETLQRTLAERAFAGTSRIGSAPWQRRDLIGCNMAVRSDVARQFWFDDALAYGCDEDDFAVRVRRSGWKIRLAPGAVVNHQHGFDLVSLLKLAWRQGRGSARFWAKQRRFLGRDIAGMVLALMAVALSALDRRFVVVSLALLVAQSLALVTAEVALKRKSLAESLSLLPVLLLHNVVKAASVLAHLPGLLVALPGPDAPRSGPGPGPPT